MTAKKEYSAAFSILSIQFFNKMISKANHSLHFSICIYFIHFIISYIIIYFLQNLLKSIKFIIIFSHSNECTSFLNHNSAVLLSPDFKGLPPPPVFYLFHYSFMHF